MSEFIPNLSSSEINFTVGKVEKSVEQKIGETTTKIVESGILKKEQFATEQDRKNKADEIVESIGRGFSSYEDMIDATCDVTRPEAQKNGQETFDILKKSISVAMNTGGDQELQTRLFTGGVREILPVSWKYDNNKASNLDLTKGVMEVTITNPKIREIYKEIDNIRQDYNMSDPTERKQAATEISEERQKLLSMRKEMPDDQKSEWLLSKEYLRMKMGILDGELNSADGSADKADVAAVLGDAAEKMAQAAEKMVQAAEKQNDVVEKFEINTDLLTTRVDNSLVYEYTEKDDPLREKISQELNQELSEGSDLYKPLKFKKAVDQVKSYAERSKGREVLSVNIDSLYEYLDFIEKGGSSVDDLSRNSDKFRVLYKVQNGDFDKMLVGSEYNGKKLGEKEIDLLKHEIDMRMFLHTFQLASSKCKSLEDILRVVSTMHEGDLDKSLDRVFTAFFLGEGGAGFKKLPVDMAWDLRQDGYFNISDLKTKIEKDEPFLNYLKDSKQKLFNKLNGKLSGSIKLREAIPKSDEYGIPETVYSNFLLMERSASKFGNSEEVVREYMIWKMMTERNCSETDTKKAFELAKKFSVATFYDSKANLSLSSDDYAELILFKYLRYSDGPGHNQERLGKSKGIGSAYTIKHVDSLTCHWLDLSRKDATKNLRPIFSPLKSTEIDTDAIVSNSNMGYHFAGVVSSQVLPVQEAFFSKISPKDVVEDLNFLNKLFARINKTTYDMCKAGIEPVYYENRAEANKVYSGLDSENEGIKGAAEAKVAEKMRKVWLTNLFYLAGINNSGWTKMNLETFEKSLYRNELIYDKNGKPGASFISIDEIHNAMKRTRVIVNVSDNDQNKKNIKRRSTN